MQVLEDIISGSSFTIDMDGASCVRSFTVIELPTTNPYSIYYDAYDMLPKVGDGHPGIPEMAVRSVTLEPFGNSRDKLRALVRYQHVGGVFVRLNGNVIRDTTYYDKNAQLIQVDYEATGMRSTRQIGTANIFRPGSVLEYDFWIQSPDLNELRAFEGALNVNDWNGGPPRTWLCTNASTSRANFAWQPRQLWWPVHMTFEFKGWKIGDSDKYVDWREVVLFRDIQTGIVPPGVKDSFDANFKNGTESGNGWIRVSAQPEMVFVNLTSYGSLPEVQEMVEA